MAQLELEQLFHNCSVVMLGAFGTSGFRGHYPGGPNSNQGEYTRALGEEQSLADTTQVARSTPGQRTSEKRLERVQLLCG